MRYEITDTAREVRSYADIIEQREGMTLAEYPELPSMLRDLAAEIERLNGLFVQAERTGCGLHIWPPTAPGEGPHGEWAGEWAIDLSLPDPSARVTLLGPDMATAATKAAAFLVAEPSFPVKAME